MGRMINLGQYFQGKLTYEFEGSIADKIHEAIECRGFANHVTYSRYIVDDGIEFMISSLTSDVKLFAYANRIDIMMMYKSSDALANFVLYVTDKFEERFNHMKIRNDFVTNSSSSSFIINFDKYRDECLESTGFVKDCPHCGASLVYRQKENVVKCDYCKSFVNR